MTLAALYALFFLVAATFLYFDTQEGLFGDSGEEDEQDDNSRRN